MDSATSDALTWTYHREYSVFVRETLDGPADLLYCGSDPVFAYRLRDNFKSADCAAWVDVKYWAQRGDGLQRSL